MSLFEAVKKTLRRWLLLDQNIESVTEVLDQTSKEFLSSHVAFYAALNQTDKEVFEKRIILFLRTTKVLGNSLAVEQSDRLLVASGAIIPVWKFPNWHYMNLHEVILVPSAFNESSEFNQEDSLIQGMVGSGPMSGKMILSKSALHQGFSNSRDKRNVAIHEFAHLIDMADGDCDGFPERLSTYAFCVPWFDLIYKKIAQIENYKSNINPYGATSKVEFFAVATEYFFERPGLLKKKHPHVYDALKDFYQQDIADIQYSIARDIRPRKKAPCPCGSKKRYKHCCYNNKSDQA
jgi:Mlc titration factor MtfA (ptsG expression regulator)